jgi:hypothetical protein
MADTTTRYALPYQESTDAPNGPALGQDLAEAVEAVLGPVDDALAALTTLVANRKPVAAQLTSDSPTSNSTALVTVMTLTLPAPGTYLVDALLIVTNLTAVGRPGFAFGGTSTPTAWRYAASAVHYNTANGSQGSAGSGTTYPSTGTAVTNTDWTSTTGWSTIQVRGLVTISVAGTLTLRLSEATGSGVVGARAGSTASAALVS